MPQTPNIKANWYITINITILCIPTCQFCIVLTFLKIMGVVYFFMIRPSSVDGYSVIFYTPHTHTPYISYTLPKSLFLTLHISDSMCVLWHNITGTKHVWPGQKCVQRGVISYVLCWLFVTFFLYRIQSQSIGIVRVVNIRK